MKKLNLLFVLLGFAQALFAQVGIGTTSPDSKAVLDLTSTTKGLLLPRMTSVQRDNIASPPQGLLIFNTNSGNLEVYGKHYGSEALHINSTSSPAITGGESAWQQFTPTADGLVTKITLTQSDPTQFGVGFTYLMTIYSGATTFGGSVSGTVIGTAIGTIAPGASGATITYTFTAPAFVSSGQNYVFQIEEYNPPAPAYYADTYFATSNTYAGSSWIGGFTNRDLIFSLHMKQQTGTGWININL